MYFEIHFQYDKMNEIMQLVKNSNLDQLEHDFALECKMKLACPNCNFSELKNVFLAIEKVKIKELFVN